ncbi:MAG: TonB-dependent receptor [Alphaproteobacteria bacterium]
MRDELQQAVAGAAVWLEAADGGIVARGESDGAGAYRLQSVTPGRYNVVAVKAGFIETSAAATVAAGAAFTADVVLIQRPTLYLQVTAKRLDETRAAIEPRIGASTYIITGQAIEAQPAGESNPLNQVMLQAPGVAQDSFGQLHIRGEHNGLQYRINGIILPEGISGFGQTLSPRFADRVELITGALPAEYGLRTAGIIDIRTKSGASAEGGSLGIYGGGNDAIQPSFEYGGSYGRFHFFVSGDYLQNSLGIESPTRTDPLHDRSRQGHGFAYLEGIIDATSRVSAILGTERGQFQIPNTPNLAPSLGLTVNGQTDFASAALDENQREITHYGVLAYQKSWDRTDLQLALFSRYSTLNFSPDGLGDILYNGVAQQAFRQSFASGLQSDASYKLNSDHTLRAGLSLMGERTISRTTSSVLPVDEAGNQTSDVPLKIFDEGGKTGWTESVYLQDEWRPVERLTINFGGRFDRVDAFTHESQPSPRINAVLEATDTTTLHAGYVRYFTPPPFELTSTTAIAKLVGTTAQPEVLLNSTARAERGNYFDVGVSQKLLPGLTAGIDSYYKESRNLIDEGQFAAPIILTPFNYRIGHQYGVELTGTYASGDFTSYANLAASHAEGKDIVSGQFNFAPDELAYIANHFIPLDHDQFITASAGASYFWQSYRFSTDLLFGTGLRRTVVTPNDGTVPAYWQVNLGISRKFEAASLGKFELRLDAVNLFDEVYKIRDGTGVGVGAPQFGPRRAFFAGLRKFF